MPSDHGRCSRRIGPENHSGGTLCGRARRHVGLLRNLQPDAWEPVSSGASATRSLRNFRIYLALGWVGVIATGQFLASLRPLTLLLPGQEGRSRVPEGNMTKVGWARRSRGDGGTENVERAGRTQRI
jgi:hypothetical protein